MNGVDHGTTDEPYQCQARKRRPQEVRWFYAPFVWLAHSQLSADAPMVGLTAEVLEINPWQVRADFADFVSPHIQLFLASVQVNDFAEL